MVSNITALLNVGQIKSTIQREQRCCHGPRNTWVVGGLLVGGLAGVEHPGEVRPCGALPPARPAVVLPVDAAAPPGVVLVLPPGEHVGVPGPRHRPGGKGSTQLLSPHCQPAQTKTRQGGD